MAKPVRLAYKQAVTEEVAAQVRKFIDQYRGEKLTEEFWLALFASLETQVFTRDNGTKYTIKWFMTPAGEEVLRIGTEHINGGAP